VTWEQLNAAVAQAARYGAQMASMDEFNSAASEEHMSAIQQAWMAFVKQFNVPGMRMVIRDAYWEAYEQA
jgi:hypothetical protein